MTMAEAIFGRARHGCRYSESASTDSVFSIASTLVWTISICCADVPLLLAFASSGGGGGGDTGGASELEFSVETRTLKLRLK